MGRDPDGPESSFRSLRQGTTDSADVETYYDAWAESYDRTLRDWQYRAPDDASELLSQAIGEERLILDVGCGTGLFADAMLRRGSYRLEGVDISKASLDRAASRGLYERVFQHDIQAVPLPVGDGAYDAAASIGVLTYIANAEALLRDLCRCVCAGGAIAFTQRSDLWEARDMPGILARLEEDGLWRKLHVSEPRQYLPGNEEFAEDVRVIHVLCRVGP